MVKTLRDEIVEAMHKAANDYRAIAMACCSGILPIRFYEENVESAIAMDQIAAKIESARCENCSNNDQEFYFCNLIGDYRDGDEFCWDFLRQ